MKNVFLSAIVALALLFSVPSHAGEPLQFGLKAGLNVTDMKFNSSVFNKSNQAGWFLDASVLYDYRSAKLDYDNVNKTIKQQQVSVPVNVRYSIGLGSTASILLFGGPQVAFNVGDKDFRWKECSNYALKKSNFSINLGFGVTALKHLQVTANYNIACGKTADVTWKTGPNAVGSALGLNKKSSRNNSWQVGVAYFF